MTGLQHVNIKIFAAENASVNWPDLIPVFHRWIQRSALPELLLDVADYAHVPAGPGIMLIGHEAFYSVDNRDGRLGLLYNRRTTSHGEPREELAHAWKSAANAARMLSAEPEFHGSLRFNEQDCEVLVNDRLIAPNTPDTFAQLEPLISEVFSSQWSRPVALTWNSDPRELFRVSVKPSE